MNRVIHKNRWFIWTLVLVVSIGLLTISYAEYVNGEIDKEASGIVIVK